MNNKITWANVYKEFRSSHPNLRKKIKEYKPDKDLTIIVYFKDGTSMKYDYYTKRCKFI